MEKTCDGCYIGGLPHPVRYPTQTLTVYKLTMGFYSKSPRPLGKVLNGLINDLGMRRKINEARVIETWAMLAGPQINAVTNSVRMRGPALHVQLNSAAWRHELHLSRFAWRSRLNKELGEDLVREIVFR